MAEARVLNRMIGLCPHGWEYEPDQRHADLIVQTMGMTTAKPQDAKGCGEVRVAGGAGVVPAPLVSMPGIIGL